MSFSYKKFALLAVVCSSLIACSSTDDEDESTRVAELTDITEQFDPKVVWSDSVDGVDKYFSRLKPAVAYGKVFTASRVGDAVAFDQNTGKELWKTDLSDLSDERSFWQDRQSALLNGGPVTGINKVFYGSENGDVYALDAETGSVSWTAKIKGEIIAAPGIGEGVLVVNSASGAMKAFDAADGKELWQTELDVPPLSLRGISAPVVASGGVLVGTASGDLTVFVLDRGQQAWTAPVGEASGSTELERVIDVDSKPLVFGDKIYSISSRGNLVAVDLRSGRVLWSRQYSSYRSLAISGNTLFLTDVKGHIYAVDRNNGLERWSQLSLTNRQVTGPTVIGNYLAVGDFEGYLHFIDQETGEFVARHRVGTFNALITTVGESAIYTSPVVAGNVLYVQSRDGDIEAITIP